MVAHDAGELDTRARSASADACPPMSHSISPTASSRRSPTSVTLLATILGSSIALLDGSGTVAVGALVAAQFSSSIDRQLAGRPLTPPGRAAVARAKRLTLGRPSVTGVPPREASAIIVASDQSSLEAFRLGIGVAGALVIIGGVIGAAGIRNPRRVVHAEQCAGGQLAGAPLDAAGLHATGAT
jgi:hypothetical protein